MRETKSSFSRTKKKYFEFLKKQEIYGQPFLNKTNQCNYYHLSINSFPFAQRKLWNSTRKDNLIADLI